uniref:Ribosomal RNA-processing protein 8 n=1 Tax=Serinus canaria TaxID=9135 RepID=A0A8C9MKB3_SERCA
MACLTCTHWGSNLLLEDPPGPDAHPDTAGPPPAATASRPSHHPPPPGLSRGGQVPLAAEAVDVAVFCLALMGTNLQEILGEANRVLKLGGTLLVAEVASRFEDTRAFLRAMTQLGFKTVSKVCA